MESSLKTRGLREPTAFTYAMYTLVNSLGMCALKELVQVHVHVFTLALNTLSVGALLIVVAYAYTFVYHDIQM